MKIGQIGLVCLGVIVVAETVRANYIDDSLIPQSPVESEPEPDYSDDLIDNLLRVSQQKRACVRRSGNCDHRPNDCCFNSSCRCNLWGTNCRCQRVGLFQKWGKK